MLVLFHDDLHVDEPSSDGGRIVRDHRHNDHATNNYQHWCGFRQHFDWEAASMLGCGYVCREKFELDPFNSYFDFGARLSPARSSWILFQS